MGGYGGGCVGHGCGHGLDVGGQVRPIVVARPGKVGLVADPLGGPLAAQMGVRVIILLCQKYALHKEA